MSRITLSGNASGTGNFTLASPNSNTDRTLTLPDATGTVNTSGAPNEVPAGSAAAPSVFPTGDTNTGVFFPAGDTTAFATAGVEAMRINSAGKMGVGTTAPNGRITVAAMPTVNPSANLNNFAMTVFAGYGGGISMIDSSDPNSGTGYAIWIDDFGNDFNIARGTTSSGAAGGVFINNSAGSWSSRSDERDKVNLEPITDAASKVQSLRAVIGEYIWAEGVRHPFLIAQDVQAVLPEAVSISNKTAPEEDQRLGLSYTDIVPLLTAALQEALAEIANLKTRLTALEAN